MSGRGRTHRNRLYGTTISAMRPSVLPTLKFAQVQENRLNGRTSGDEIRNINSRRQQNEMRSPVTGRVIQVLTSSLSF